MRSVLKTTIYFFYWFVALFFDRGQKNNALVLMYHAVEEKPESPNISPKDFERQMEYLSRQKTVVPLQEVVDAQKNDTSLSTDHVAVTFDDGYRDLLTTVLPVIERYSIPVTVFVPSDLSAQADPKGRQRLNLDELQTLAQSPLVSIESHGRSHRRLTTLSPEELKEELEGSRIELQSYLVTEPKYVAYPFGARNPEVEAAAQEANYEAGFGITDGVVGSSSSLFALHRIHIDHTMSFPLFRLRLTRAVEISRIMRKWRRRLGK